MEAFDTNVVVRLIVRDDEAQCRPAERTFRAAIDAGLALAAYESGAADFSEFFILESARRGGALPLHTFDERLSRANGAKLVD